jgi:chromosome segregation ATPase
LANSNEAVNGRNPHKNGADVKPEIIGIEPKKAHQGEGNTRVVSPQQISFDNRRNLADRAAIATSVNTFDVGEELDALLNSLHPDPSQISRVASSDESGSISGILSAIVVGEPITHTQQLLQELNAASERSIAAQTELQLLHQRNQLQVDRIDASSLQIQQLKSRIQELVRQGKSQVVKAGQLLAYSSQIQTEIVTTLNRFGGYERLNSLLLQLDAARAALEIDRSQTTAEREAVSESLQVIEARVAKRAQAAEAKLQEYEESIGELSQAISTDRLLIGGMSVDLSTKVSDLHDLHSQIVAMHGQIVETSQTVRSQISQIDRRFSELSASISAEKEQFYALTVETIDKADLIRDRLAEAFAQINVDRQQLTEFKADLQTLQNTVRKEAQQKLINFDLRDRELISLCNNLQTRHKDLSVTVKQLSTWLWVLSFTLVVLFALTIRIAVSLN